MANWKIFKHVGTERVASNSRVWEWYSMKVDGWIEFKDRYNNCIELRFLPEYRDKLYARYVEIDIDKTKCESKDCVFDPDVVRIVPLDVVRERERNEMIRASSVDPTALAITREGMDRVDLNQQNEFEYKMEDNSGNKHQWIYRKR